MKFVADLHLHSRYSRAVSGAMTLPNMHQWAIHKGINVLASGDFTHPFWLDHLKKELHEAGNGLFRLSNAEINDKSEDIYFLLSSEISSIYSQGGKVRRVHNLFFFPSIKAVEKFNKSLLDRRSNLRSDGRPIVGIPSRDLAQIAFEADERALVIPAHVWTPWFSVYGSFSGFDSIDEAFGDMAKNIYGIETGLSSDPVMNWRVGDLDKRAILSFSDAHSLEKMGREATVFEAEEISYDAIYDAISKPSAKSKIAFTIEFHPEEGKYHFSGHRDCNVSFSVEETKKVKNICPVCKRALTIGVMHRVDDLATYDAKCVFKNVNDVRWVMDADQKRPPYVSMVPLLEIIAEAVGSAFKTKKVMDIYFMLIQNLGSEFAILMKSSISEISKYAPERVVEGIAKVRSGKIVIEPGYDGKFGVVKIWHEEALGVNVDGEDESQLNLFV